MANLAGVSIPLNCVDVIVIRIRVLSWLYNVSKLASTCSCSKAIDMKYTRRRSRRLLLHSNALNKQCHCIGFSIGRPSICTPSIHLVRKEWLHIAQRNSVFKQFADAIIMHEAVKVHADFSLILARFPSITLLLA